MFDYYFKGDIVVDYKRQNPKMYGLLDLVVDLTFNFVGPSNPRNCGPFNLVVDLVQICFAKFANWYMV